MLGPFAKVTTGCLVVSGSACAVGFPLSSVSKSSHNSPNIVSSSRELDETDCKSQLFDSSTAEFRGQTVNFHILGNRIKSQLNKENLCKNPPFKEELKNILETVYLQQKGIVKEEAGEDCSGNKPCGYLEFETDHSKGRVKLLIIFDEHNSNKKEWKLRIIKSGNDGQPSYYNGYPDTKQVSTPTGIAINNSQGNNFSKFSDSGNQLENFSIIKQTV